MAGDTSTDMPARRFETLVADVAACQACERMAHAHVLGDASGPIDALVVFIAEAVGRRGGAVSGVPLTRDESGKRFQDFLALAGMRRTDCFITNAVLCNPIDDRGRNRTPSVREIARCRPFLARTLDVVRAPTVVTLGRVALEALRAVAPHEGSLPDERPRGVPWRSRTLIPMYHPSRRSTLHRAHERQEQDWRDLGDLIRAQRSLTALCPEWALLLP